MNDLRLAMRLRPNVSVESDPNGTIVRHPWGSATISGPDWIAALLTQLGERELDTDAILNVLIDHGLDNEIDIAAALVELEAIFRRVAMVIQRSVYRGDVEVLQLTPVGKDAPPATVGTLPDNSVITLDRVAYLRRREGHPGLSLESPLSHHRAQLGEDVVALLGTLASNALEMGTVTDGGLRAAVGLLVSVNLLRADHAPHVGDSSWSFHDLLFHARSRQGRTDEAFGAISEEGSAADPPPPVAVRPRRDYTSLFVPTFDAVVSTDLRLSEAIESRRSIRDYADQPLSLEELGELLYRSARARGIFPVPFHEAYDGMDRPYPTGGMAGDLEIYVTAPRCDGLDAGTYYYNAVHHRLESVATIETAQPLLIAAKIATGYEIEPQVLLTFTSRFERTSWKYGSIAYALTLKHVGVLMQTVYLVATSMGLAPCALGSGDADAAATVFDLDYLEESSVGEMLVGRPLEPPARATSFRDLVTSPDRS